MHAAILRKTQVSSIEVMDQDLDSPEVMEAATLAITNDNEDKIRNDLWVRPASHKRRELPVDGSTILNLVITVARIMPPEGEDLNIKRYVVYELTVTQDSSQALDVVPVRIERRYTDFRKLYEDLKKISPEIGQFHFPSKVLVGNFSTDLITERSACFENLLQLICHNSKLRDSAEFLYFLQDIELTKACQYLDERRHELAIPLLENSFRLLNKILMDRARPVLMLLCRLVAACTFTPVPHQNAERWANLALNRYETLSDIDMLSLYIPLLNTCAHLWWQKGRDQQFINNRLTEMKHKGINIQNVPTLLQAIHKLEPRTELH